MRPQSAGRSTAGPIPLADIANADRWEALTAEVRVWNKAGPPGEFGHSRVGATVILARTHAKQNSGLRSCGEKNVTQRFGIAYATNQSDLDEFLT